MPKFASLLTISLLLAATAIAPACDVDDAPPDTELPESPRFREGVNAEFESLQYADKIIRSCIEVERPVTFTLVEGELYVDGMQSFSILLESTAPADQVACLLGILEDNQP